MDLASIVYALLAAAVTIVVGVAARVAQPGTPRARLQGLAWFLLGAFFMQILVLGGYRPELVGAFLIAALIASVWTFARKMVIRERERA